MVMFKSMFTADGKQLKTMVDLQEFLIERRNETIGNCNEIIPLAKKENML